MAGNEYIQLNKGMQELLKPSIQSGDIEISGNNGRKYALRSDIQKMLENQSPRNPEYTPDTLRSYDSTRHIPIYEGIELVKSQGDPNLEPERLRRTISEGKIHVYEFKGEQYLDRLDIGRVYHQSRTERKGLTIDRYFSTEGENPFESVGNYERRHLQIKDIDGETIFDMPDAEFPESWSVTGSKIVAQKYFFKPDKDEWKEKIKGKIGKDHEFSPVHLITRETNFIADEGEKLGYFASLEDKKKFVEELEWLQINQKFAFNSPVQFNAGIYNEYGIKGTRGLGFFRDPKTGEVTKNEWEYVHPQSHACFINGPTDDLDSILEHHREEGSVFSLGSGIGQDIGKLRAEGEPLSGGGKSSGPMSFLKVYDYGAGSIKSGGKSRRAARMTTMRQSHPNIMEFIRDKVKEDHKARDLMLDGWSTGMDGEAATTVAYQNTNLSVRLDDEFFEQLDKGGEIELRFVKSGEIAGTVSAERMLKEISFGSWRIGDPGIQYESKIQEMHTVKNLGDINSSNPCSEYMSVDDTACDLASLNLIAFSDEEGNFDIESYRRANKLVAVASDVLNSASSYPIESIARVSPELRNIGVGYAGLGALLMRRGLAYDSEEGRALAGAITSLMTGSVYEASTELAEKLETFTHFEFNKKPMMDVMKKHKKNLDDILWEYVPEDLKKASYESWDNVVERGEKHGFRNSQATVLAPTGTISYLMGVYNSTGVEPSVALKIWKSLAGGGGIEIVNEEVPNALRNLGYNSNQVEDIQEFIAKNGTVINSLHMNPDHYKVFDTALGNKEGVGSIDFAGHTRMLGAAQPFISGAISKTNNMPEDATVKDIYDGFVMGHDLGLKAMAVFRNNSKPTAALGFGQDRIVELKRGEKEEMPTRRKGLETEVKINGTAFHVLSTDYDDGRPGQLAFLSYMSGSTLKALLETQGIIASKALQRGVDLEDVVSGWLGQKFEPFGFVQGHPMIKTALSPLDFAAKLLLVEYKGQTDLAEDSEGLTHRELWGAQNGAFETYEMMNVDDWDFEVVLNHPRLGGFKNGNTKNKNSAKKKQNNDRGVHCNNCGNLMNQTNTNCYECSNCGDKIGGCGA